MYTHAHTRTNTHTCVCAYICMYIHEYIMNKCAYEYACMCLVPNACMHS